MTQQFIIIILLIALGYFLKHLNFLKANDSQVLSTLVFNVTLPSLVIVNLNKAELDPSLSVLSIMMIIYGLVAKTLVVYLFLKYDNQVRGTVGMMMASLNIGLFAYPLVAAIWPDSGMIYFGMADIGGALIMFGVTYFVGSYFSSGGDSFDFKYLAKNIVKSVPLMTYMIMFILNMANIHFPKPVTQFFSDLSGANMPLSMILLGLMLNFNIDKRYLPIALKYLGIHYGFGIAMGLLVHFFLPVSDPMIKTTLQVAWILPVGITIIPYSIQFKYKTIPLTGMVINASIIISIILIYVYQALFV